MDDLVKQARELCIHTPLSKPMIMKCAARIEELEARLEQYRALYEAAWHDAEEAEAYAEALEAKLYDIAQGELKGQDQ